MKFSYKATNSELIGREVSALYYNKPWNGTFSGTIVKFLSNNRVRLAHANNEFSTPVFREEWRTVSFEPQVGDTVYGTAGHIDPEIVGKPKYEKPYWSGVIQEVHDDYVIVKMTNSGRLSKRKTIRPRP